MYFVKVYIAQEKLKRGIDPKDTKNFLETCKSKYDINVIGLMCLPPYTEFTEKYFKEMLDLKMSLPDSYQFQAAELSMGMSNDYIKAIAYKTRFIRIGTKIFGERK